MIFHLKTRNLTKNFGDFVAVRSVNLQVPKDTIFGFLGPNGSGKSITVKMLTGILSPSAGEAIAGRVSITDVPLATLPALAVIFLSRKTDLLASLLILVIVIVCFALYLDLNHHRRKAFRARTRKDDAVSLKIQKIIRFGSATRAISRARAVFVQGGFVSRARRSRAIRDGRLRSHISLTAALPRENSPNRIFT